MRAEQIIYSLLSQSIDLGALVADRIWCPVRPEEAALVYPALTYALISAVEEPPIDVGPGTCLVTARVQITGIALTYPSLKQVMEQVRLAVNYRSGLITGVRVISVLRELVGLDIWDPEVRAYSQSCDYAVTFYE